ncbi:MAG: type I-C CRISPR-associated protein Cas8c/Csd1, partial [Hyphomicrobiaceae bacterium]|nr:type I-C CRISPR-associated protein Cas8c/Csd1 [Hyphomicrobiaceae bacterium]
MSLLSALVRAYDRLPKDIAPPFGYSTEKIGFCVVLEPDGSVSHVIDLRGDDKRRSPRMLAVPASPKRSGSTPRPNFLWDNANYALGIGKLKDANDMRYDSFREKHLEYLAHATTDELRALCLFLKDWQPENCQNYFDLAKPPTEGIVFALSKSYRNMFLHETEEARRTWVSERDRWIAVPGKSTERAICLVSGERSSIQRTHPPIKGVWGGKTEMALISFNSEAYESYSHEQGDNAPISEAAAFAYTTALNRFLSDRSHRLQIGDASTVFWADAEGNMAAEAESLFAAFFDTAADDKIETAKVKDRLEGIRNGQRLVNIAPELAEGVRFYVLGLAPNAARLSVRFYWESDFGTLTANYQHYLLDGKVKPEPEKKLNLPRLLCELAPLTEQERKLVLARRYNDEKVRKKIPANLAGEWMRAILTGTPYPMTLLSTVLMRIRADGEVNALRAAILKSVLIRNFNKEAPVALDPANTDKGYILGRLFAAYEEVQRAALGGNVNATIKDK